MKIEAIIVIAIFVVISIITGYLFEKKHLNKKENN